MSDRPFLKHWLPAALILLVSAGLYACTLHLPFRDPDHSSYFAELDGNYSFQNAARLTDYGLTRRYWKGDEILYRPLLFIWLALESHFFTYHAFYWNLANLLVHLMVLLLLYLTLRQINRSPFAIPFTLLFALSLAPAGLVLNPHLGGYLLSFACLLGAYFFVLKIALSKEIKPAFLAGYFLCATAGCFFYEFLFFFVIAAAPLLQGAAPGKQKKYWLVWLGPLAVYLAAYAFRNFGATTHFLYIDNRDTDTFLGLGNLAQTPRDLLRMLSDLSRDILPDLRLHKILMLAGFFLAFLSGLKRLNPGIPAGLKVFPFALLALYVLLLAYLRGTFFREYYPYLFYLLLTIGIYGLINFESLKGWKSLPGFLLLAVMILWNGFHTSVFLKDKAEGYAEIGHYLNSLARFTDKHRMENDFGFEIVNADPEIDWQVNLREGYPRESNPNIYVPFSKILFRPWVRETNPLYTLKWNSKDASFAVTRNE